MQRIRAAGVLSLLVIGVMACGQPKDASMAADTTPSSELDRAIATAQPETAAPTTRTYIYQCGNDYRFTAHISVNTTLLELPDNRRIVLPRVVSASGTRYSDGTVTYWSKGTSALLETGSQSFSNCKIVTP